MGKGGEEKAMKRPSEIMVDRKRRSLKQDGKKGSASCSCLELYEKEFVICGYYRFFWLIEVSSQSATGLDAFCEKSKEV